MQLQGSLRHERSRSRERKPVGKVGGAFRALRLLHRPRVKKDTCVGAAARLRARTEQESERRSDAAADALDFDWRKGERSDVQNLDGNAAGQASYRPAGLPFPLIDCGSGGWGAKVVTKRCQKV